MPGLEAVLWDFDGTLIDSEPYWMAEEQALVAEFGGTWTHEDAMGLVGNDLLVTGQVLRDVGGVGLTPAQIVDRLLEGVTRRLGSGVPWRPGARELLADLGSQGLATGLVTMSWRINVAPVLAQLPADAFDTVVTGEDVTNGKPDPEPYLQAAANLGLEPRQCLAIEDSPTGATSAAAAGCGVLVVVNHVPVPPAPGRVFRASLADLSVADLTEIWRESLA